MSELEGPYDDVEISVPEGGEILKCHPDVMWTEGELRYFLGLLEAGCADVERLLREQQCSDMQIFQDPLLTVYTLVPDELHEDIGFLFEIPEDDENEEDEEDEDDIDNDNDALSFLPPSNSFEWAEADEDAHEEDESEHERELQQEMMQIQESARRLATWFIGALEDAPEVSSRFLEHLLLYCADDTDHETRLGLVEFLEQVAVNIRNGKNPEKLPDSYQVLIDDWRQCHLSSLPYDRDYRQQLGSFGRYLYEHIHHLPSSVAFLAQAKGALLPERADYMQFEEGVEIPLYFIAFGLKPDRVVQQWPAFQDHGFFS